MSPASEMTTNPLSSSEPDFPPWKRELLLRRSALARTVEPNLSLVCRRLQKQRRPLPEAIVHQEPPSKGEGRRRPVPSPPPATTRSGGEDEERGQSATTGKREKRIHHHQQTEEGEEESEAVAVETLKGGEGVHISACQRSAGQQERDGNGGGVGQSVEWNTFDWNEGGNAGSGPGQERANPERKVSQQWSGREKRGSAKTSASSLTSEETTMPQHQGRNRSKPRRGYNCSSPAQSGDFLERLDSDGTMNSGGDSDSSEEIHYGPGFVNRLKNRYMNVALRGSSWGSTGILRRTASLEDFLEEERATHLKSHDKVLSSSKARHDHRRFPNNAPGRHHKQRGRPSKYNSSKDRKESVKRAQSVEVLSANDDQSSGGNRGQPGHHALRHQRPVPHVPKPPQTDLDSIEAPPPLPPKEEKFFKKVMNSLASEVGLVDKIRLSSAQSLLHVSATDSSTDERSVHKRNASSAFSRAEQKELPAPDTVKETRKIFESRSGPVPVPTHCSLGLNSKPVRNPHPSQPSSVDGRLFENDSEDHVVQVMQRSAISSQQHQPRPSQSVAPQPILRNVCEEAACGPKPNLPSKPTHPSPTNTSATPNHVKEDPLRKEEDILGGGKNPKAARATFLDMDNKGVKLVSSDAIIRIREEGSSFTFNFRKNANGVAGKKYLPTMSGRSVDTENSVGRQVGVIRPITREAINQDQANNMSNMDMPEPVDDAIYPRGNAQLPSSQNPCKRGQKVIWEEERKERAAVKSEKNPPSDLVSDAGSGVDSDEVRPEVPCNGQNYYRESWKKRTEEQNTIVFNFINSEKEVSHIENDGRDITKLNFTGKAPKRNLSLAKVRRGRQHLPEIKKM